MAIEQGLAPHFDACNACIRGGGGGGGVLVLGGKGLFIGPVLRLTLGKYAL